MSAKTVKAKTSLIFGGARSGKSKRAEQIVEQFVAANPGARKVYMATAEIRDDEMTTRVDEHRARRDGAWTTIDVPLALDIRLRNDVGLSDVVLVDCLTMWLSNLMATEMDVSGETDKLMAAIAESPATLVLVSNEVGFGIVPDNSLARKFRDAHGVLNQKVAASVEHVEFIAAGLPLQLKP